MKIYKSRKSLLFQIIFMIAITLLIGITLKILLEFDNAKIVPLIIIVLCLVLLVWAYLGTFYKISDTHFHYQSGPLRGKIAVKKIIELNTNTTMWIGMKPALATKGIVLKHTQFNEIYISPENQEEFVTELVKTNPNIKVT